MDGHFQFIDHSAGIASKDADTDWLSTDITPRKVGSILRFAVVLATARAIKLVDDTGTQLQLNAGATLVANALYHFDVLTSNVRTYNLQNIGGASAIDYLVVVELSADKA